MFDDYEMRKAIGTKAKISTKGGKAKKVKREPEAEEQKALVRWANQTVINGVCIGKYLTHVPNEGVRGPKAKRDFGELGGSVGYPDLILDIPTAKYPGLRIEMKAPPPNRSVITESQAEWVRNLVEIGYCAVVCHSFEEAKAVIIDYMEHYPYERSD